MKSSTKSRTEGLPVFDGIRLWILASASSLFTLLLVVVYLLLSWCGEEVFPSGNDSWVRGDRRFTNDDL